MHVYLDHDFICCYYFYITDVASMKRMLTGKKMTCSSGVAAIKIKNLYSIHGSYEI